MMEKLEILGYMVENGFELGDMTMDEWAAMYSEQELWKMCQYMLGQAEEW